MKNWKNPLSFSCIEMSQPIGMFYVGAVKASDLIDISYADIRRVEERDVEKYLGIQRPLSDRRVKELKQYVTNVDATFPTGVILAIDSENAVYDSKTKTMHINRLPLVAKIIDGQHRLAGLEDYKGDSPFELNVTIFIDMDVENQAMVFATINLAQTKVNKSLVYDLYELTKSRSPQKTSHNIAKLMNTRNGSPFIGRIKMLGVATEDFQPLTQAAMVESIIRWISGDTLAAMKDRDLLLRGETLERATGKNENKLIFRDLFIDERDADIIKLLWDYFKVVSEKWTVAWNGVDTPGNILPRTNGFRALMRLFRAIYLHLDGKNKVLDKAGFKKVLLPISLKDDYFTSDIFKPGTSGEADLYTELLKYAKIPNPG